MLPFTSIDAAASAPTVGEVRDYEDVRSHHTVVAVLTGSPTSCTVSMQGSHDGVNWFNLATATISSGTPSVIVGSNSGIFDHAARYVRARLENLQGGTAPTVTATIAST